MKKLVTTFIIACMFAQPTYVLCEQKSLIKSIAPKAIKIGSCVALCWALTKFPQTAGNFYKAHTDKFDKFRVLLSELLKEQPSKEQVESVAKYSAYAVQGLLGLYILGQSINVLGKIEKRLCSPSAAPSEQIIQVS